MTFDQLWRTMTEALKEPVLLAVPATDAKTTKQSERFHAWFDPGGDGKPEAIWTKPLQGEKQVRLPQRQEDYRKVYDAVQAGDCASLEECRNLTLRGHYLYAVMRHFGWDPPTPGPF